ncbi:hypothetical protein [Aestuariimicrobium ganziense]|uniref:hypothetical protein n=1 Tax=Aestuariimicrobium ganziense TaxID=2773677 RepID=UPI0019419AD6|nr:hypothetical protein [Aestuariimicrobium ganziense]
MTVIAGIEAHLALHGVCAVSEHPQWSRRLAELADDKVLVRLLPGIYAVAANARETRIRCAALMLWDPDAVVTGLAAAALTFWPKARVAEVEFHSRRKKRSYPGFRLHRSQVPPDQVSEVQGLRLVSSAWAAVHRAAVDDGVAIDEYLRASFGKVAHVAQALVDFGRRVGNPMRRAVVTDSRSNPWSPRERRLHGLLRRAGIVDWVANLKVIADGTTHFLDIAFRDCMVAFEYHGVEHHLSSASDVINDHQRTARLAAEGWTIVPLTTEALDDVERLIDLVRRTLDSHRRGLVTGGRRRRSGG